MNPKEASAVKRIAGNIAGRLIPDHVYDQRDIAREAVDLAIAINDEVNRRVVAQGPHEVEIYKAMMDRIEAHIDVDSAPETPKDPHS